MRILIIRFSSLGDLVSLEPLIRSIRYFHPNAKIDFVSSSVGISLYKNTGYFDNIFKYEGIKKTIINFGVKYDWLINLQCNKPSHFLSLFINKTHVINKSFGLLQKIFKIKTHSKSAREILSIMGINSDLQSEYWNDPKSTIITLKGSGKRMIDTNKKLVVVSTGASERWKTKKWSLQNYIELIKKLTDGGYQVALVGSQLELVDAERISKFISEVFVMVGKTDVGDMLDIFEQASLYIGNDSGPSHVAASVGCSTITLFGPTSVKHCVKNLSYAGNHICMKSNIQLSCAPCYKTLCPTNHECMSTILVDDVWIRVNDLMAVNDENYSLR